MGHVKPSESHAFAFVPKPALLPLVWSRNLSSKGQQWMKLWELRSLLFSAASQANEVVASGSCIRFVSVSGFLALQHRGLPEGGPLLIPVLFLGGEGPLRMRTSAWQSVGRLGLIPEPVHCSLLAGGSGICRGTVQAPSFCTERSACPAAL